MPAICKQVLVYVPGSSMDENSKVENLATAMVIMHGLCMKMESEDAAESLEGVVSVSYNFITQIISYVANIQRPSFQLAF